MAGRSDRVNSTRCARLLRNPVTRLPMKRIIPSWVRALAKPIGLGRHPPDGNFFCYEVFRQIEGRLYRQAFQSKLKAQEGHRSSSRATFFFRQCRDWRASPGRWNSIRRPEAFSLPTQFPFSMPPWLENTPKSQRETRGNRRGGTALSPGQRKARNEVKSEHNCAERSWALPDSAFWLT